MDEASRTTALDVSRYKNPDNDPRGPWLPSNATAPFERLSLQYEWHGKLPPKGRSWRYTKEHALALDAEGRTVLSASGMIRIKRYLSEAKRWPADDKPVPGTPRLELIVRTAMRGIAVAIAHDPDCLQGRMARSRTRPA
jgi:hypothetical protein